MRSLWENFSDITKNLIFARGKGTEGRRIFVYFVNEKIFSSFFLLEKRG